MLSDYFGEYSNYNLTYSPSGMVGIKSCDDMLWNYWYGFCSINNHIASHQVRSIYDLENDETSYLLYNPEGQVQNIFRPCTGEFRTHRWTEAGQLAGVTDNDRCGYYGYDGNGDRVYKLTGYSVMEQMDANEPVYEAYFSDAVLYVNPYFVVTPKGYTKHIYNGSQRVATHLGTTDLQECIDTTASGRERLNNAREYMHALLYQTDEIPIDRNERFVDIDGDDYDELQWQCTDYESQYLIVNIEEVCDSDMLLPTIQQGDPTVTDVFPIYFYHSDHLGSATWITDYYGNVKQFLHYMPYGELFLNQQTSHYNERFKFTGKERDTETNYDYFGARYYSSDLTAWLSPDPLSDKYPSINPYAYCNWNPVKYIDPEGKWIEVSQNDDGTYHVENGQISNDKNIYITREGNRTGEILGTMFTKYSFFSDDGNVIKSDISLSDQSGNIFLSENENNAPTIIDYISSAEMPDNNSGRNFGKYDFKSNGITKNVIEKMSDSERDIYYYRGMPININGKIYYGTARDIGNYYAGYLAGAKGMGIIPMLVGFDLYQYKKNSSLTEPPVSRIPQLKGYCSGIIDFFIKY